MNRFPASVRRGMREAGATATCVPVKLDDGDWESVFFIQVSGEESRADRSVLKQAAKPLPIGIEADLLELENAAVVVLRLEIHTLADNPMATEILLTPGASTGHFDALERLTRQERLCWFFGDENYDVIHAQQHALNRELQTSMESLLDDAVKHDAVIRITGRYDARSALSSVVSHYELRAAAGQSANE